MTAEEVGDMARELETHAKDMRDEVEHEREVVEKMPEGAEKEEAKRTAAEEAALAKAAGQGHRQKTGPWARYAAFGRGDV